MKAAEVAMHAGLAQDPCGSKNTTVNRPSILVGGDETVQRGPPMDGELAGASNKGPVRRSRD